MEHDLIEQATQLNTREEYVAWEQRCDEFMESLVFSWVACSIKSRSMLSLALTNDAVRLSSYFISFTLVTWYLYHITLMLPLEHVVTCRTMSNVRKKFSYVICTLFDTSHYVYTHVYTYLINAESLMVGDVLCRISQPSRTAVVCYRLLLVHYYCIQSCIQFSILVHLKFILRYVTFFIL